VGPPPQFKKEGGFLIGGCEGGVDNKLYNRGGTIKGFERNKNFFINKHFLGGFRQNWGILGGGPLCENTGKKRG